MKPFRTALLLALLASSATLACAADTTVANAELPNVPFTETHLENGLRVILAPDKTAPVFGIAVTYNVGSRDERPGRTGFAHLFEHMMFQGSENVGKGEHFILVFNNGGNMNGTTNEDRTNYFEALPKNQLDLALFLEADRMAKLAVNQANLENQRNAVQEERRLGVDNQPYGRSYLEIDNLGYDTFAYKHSTIGSMSDLNAANLKDVQEFFRIYYAPNNAVLTLVGDFEPADAVAKVKKYFGGIARQPAPPAPDVTEEEHAGERRATIYDPLARLPQVLMAYHIPPGNTPENYTAQVLADVLGEGESSRLYQRLVKEKQLATSIQVQADARRGPSSFYVMATPRAGVKPEDVEKAIYDEIAALTASGVTPQEMDKARTQALRRMIQARQSDMSTAVRMGQYAVYFDHPGLINTWLAKYDAVTAEQVQAAAKKYLVAKQRTVVTTFPAAEATHQQSTPGGQP
jgi:zinc protease